MNAYTKKELAIIEAAATIVSKKGKKQSPKAKAAEVKPVSVDLRKAVIGMIEAEAAKPKGNGYQFSHYLAAKIYYAAKAKGQNIDPNAMSDKTASILAKAYSL